MHHRILASSTESLKCLTTAEQHEVSILSLHFNQVFVLLILQALIFLVDLRNDQLCLQVSRVVQGTLHKQACARVPVGLVELFGRLRHNLLIAVRTGNVTVDDRGRADVSI